MLDLIPPFGVVPMPLNKDGNGPADVADTEHIDFEVWDAAHQTSSKHICAYEAEAYATLLNTCKSALFILKHVEKIGWFEPPQYHGGYDNLHFTHEQYNNFIDQLTELLQHTAKDASIAGTEELSPIKILVMPFTVGGTAFILRHLECGEYADQLMTQQEYESSGLDV